MTESDDGENFDETENEFLFQPLFDDIDASCIQGLTGLYNHGNTCYVNATIQALSNWYAFICYRRQYVCICVNVSVNIMLIPVCQSTLP